MGKNWGRNHRSQSVITACTEETFLCGLAYFEQGVFFGSDKMSFIVV